MIAGPDSGVENTPERLLETQFAEMVGSISVADIIVVGPDRTRPSLEAYGLTHIVQSGPWRDSMWPTGYGITVPPNIVLLSEHVGIETSRGIGWTHNNTLLAISAAGIAGDRLRIQQLQGTVDGIDNSPTALEAFRSGILWEHTLVRTWMQIGRSIGIGEVEIRSARNNPHVQTSGKQRIIQRALKRYDGTAQDLGFNPDPDTNNWVLAL